MCFIGDLKILARLMTAKFLHTEIREKGGAYGGGAKLSRSGVFTLYSYRDPNTIETLQSCGKVVYWAKSGKFMQQGIDKAKLSVFSTVDAPVAPSDKGMDHFLYGLSDEMKQAHREQLFTVSHDKLLAVSDRYLGTGKSAWPGHTRTREPQNRQGPILDHQMSSPGAPDCRSPRDNRPLELNMKSQKCYCFFQEYCVIFKVLPLTGKSIE
ncbi:presequence protease, mitochondrial-like isoform X2 [Trachypithecus francoisi]|uniref:presequence protease, mitochondrial-like isoform X2 n=1 Tax=Trachypithecus francoisi TaxID=54180 RepID=UPI00141BC564|nr:presequence protease, mitochondrial-like isoform X2 [Trachypithecus francoisi]